MKRIYIYLMFITLVSAANTCGINKVGPAFYFSKEFKDYTLFNEGSKWIYQLENSKTLDTMITIYRNVEVKQPNGEDRNYELTLTRDTSSYYQEIIIQFGHVAEFGQQFDNLKVLFESTLPNTSPSYFQTETIGQSSPSLGIKYSEFKDDYTIGGINFQQVKVFDVLVEPFDKRLPKKVFYAKHIGLIRKELWNGQVWNLVDYEVSQ